MIRFDYKAVAVLITTTSQVRASIVHHVSTSQELNARLTFRPTAFSHCRRQPKVLLDKLCGLLSIAVRERLYANAREQGNQEFALESL